MGEVAHIKQADLSANQLRLVKNTIAAELRDDEFDLFMQFCKSAQLDPFRGHVFPVVFNAKKDTRRVARIIGRDGRRILAQRCKDYRPASEPTKFEKSEDMKGPTNPHGLISAVVTLYKQDSKGDWYPVVGEAYWDEFAPVKDVWEYSQELGKRAPTGDKELSGKWKDMPRLMLGKCAEAQALRAGWPDAFSNVYSEEEFHRLEAEAASEEIKRLEIEERTARLGGPGIMLCFDDNAPLEKVPYGQVFDRVEEWLKTATPEDAFTFQGRNQDPLRDFWAHEKADALELRKKLEAKSDGFNPAGEK